MKTIKVTDEMHGFLTELSKELNTQNHRGTRMPYFFQIQTKEQVAAPEGNGIKAWFYDGSLIETKEEIKEAVIEWQEHSDKEIEFDNLDDYEIEEILEKAGWSEVWYEYKTNLENAFFTEKACKEHIEMNAYHYKEPVDYLSFASRNNEMETVMRFLCELTGGKLHH